jgi:SpoVK/Ycf46/Vps4 family AAA+-type ATPase
MTARTTSPKSERRRRRVSPQTRELPFADIRTLWLLRAKLCRQDNAGQRGARTRRAREVPFEFVELPMLAEGPGDDRGALLRKLQRLQRLPVRREGLTFHNAGMLADALCLAATDREILTFLVYVAHDAELDGVVSSVLRGELTRIAELLSRITALPVDEVGAALRSGGALRAARVIRVDASDDGCGLFVTVAPRIRDALAQEHDDADALLSVFCRQAPESTLSLADFAHATAVVDALRAVLTGALDQRALAANVLVFGAPGTGKTELARLLARECRAYLAEVPGEDVEGEPVDGAGRLVGYALAQRMLAGRARAMVLFDEMEDAFATPLFDFGFLFSRSRPSEGKAWKTRLLEQNAKPTIWLCNSIAGVDPALLRRFDLVLELPKPPPRVRRQMLARSLSGLPVGDAWIEAAADDDRLSPALAERAGRALRLAGHDERAAAERFLTGALSGLLDAQGPRRAVTPTRPVTYDLAFTNADVDLDAILRGLAKRGRGTICLYGPSGTGKSDFARYLAATLGRPLVSRRASDLLGRYVGETEENLAQAFREARDALGVLLLDEADGFLRERSRATASWEITQVNELLVQMEAFDGIFVCTTNLYESLDAASLRRFDVKVRFDPLREEQRWAMFVAVLGGEAAAARAGDGETREALGRLDGITPGDFATVTRRAVVLDQALDAESLLRALGAEWRAKPAAARRTVGFG